MNMSERGLNLLKHFEGLRLTAYRDVIGVLTIGYGHTSSAGPPTVTVGMKITEAQATEILRRDLGVFERAVERMLTRTPTQAQFDAMVSLCYNIGERNFAKSSVLRKFNEGDIAGATAAFALWNKAGGRVVQGLKNRRAEEAAHFASQSPAVVPPSADAAPVDIPASPKPDEQRKENWFVALLRALRII